MSCTLGNTTIGNVAILGILRTTRQVLVSYRSVYEDEKIFSHLPKKLRIMILSEKRNLARKSKCFLVLITYFVSAENSSFYIDIFPAAVTFWLIKKCSKMKNDRARRGLLEKC